MPHELIGMERDSLDGILLSLTLMSKLEERTANLTGTNKAKQQQRYSRMYAKNPHLAKPR